MNAENGTPSIAPGGGYGKRVYISRTCWVIVGAVIRQTHPGARCVPLSPPTAFALHEGSNLAAQLQDVWPGTVMNTDAPTLSLLPYILRFSDLVAWVIGDSILDVYVHGRVQRVSPEGPIPVVLFTSQETRLGGAANIAANCARLGATTLLFSVRGADADGEEI